MEMKGVTKESGDSLFSLYDDRGRLILDPVDVSIGTPKKNAKKKA
jgi:hypothetical protein